MDARKMRLHSPSQQSVQTEADEFVNKTFMPAQFGGEGFRKKKRFVGVRQRSSGRWVAEIKDTTKNIRLWLGTFATAEDAARAYDEAACLLRGANTRTNFFPHSSHSPVLHSKTARLLLDRRNMGLDAAPSTAIESTSNSRNPTSRGFNSSKHKNVSVSDFSDNEHERFSQSTSRVAPFSNAVDHFNSLSRRDIYSLEQQTRKSSDYLPENELESILFSENNQIVKLWDMDFGKDEQMKNEQEVLPKVGQFAEISQLGAINEGYMQNALELGEQMTELEKMGGSSLYHSPFRMCEEMAIPTCSMDELRGLHNASAELCPVDGVELEENAQKQVSVEEASIIKEQILRLSFERSSSASLYAMNGVHELCLIQARSSGRVPCCISSPSLSLPASFR